MNHDNASRELAADFTDAGGSASLVSGEDKPLSMADYASSDISGMTPESVYSLSLRGGAVNPLIDASSPLITLILHVFNLTQYDDINELHKRCKHEIESIELEMHRSGAYDRVTILAHRYCLCSVIDEAVMCSPWGQNSDWSERSLLALFHDETWGGEKYFIVLERLMMEPSRYLHIIEFLYLCLCLGYEGKYRPMHNGRMQLEALIKEVHDVIRKERGASPQLSLMKGGNIVEKLHQVSWQTPIAMVVGGAVLLCVLLYVGFFFYAENTANAIIHDLQQILNQ